MRELTDSYCERCGTCYTFGPSPAKGSSLNGARLLAKGLKNFVMTDGTSMDEAMAAARIDVTKDESSRVTEEFHRTFNFCMTCRQYACEKCWNENQSACLSCAPLWDQEPVAPQNHLIVRTPVSRQDLGGTAKAPSLADLAPRPAGSPDAVPWPDADPLPGRTSPRPVGDGHGLLETAPAIPVAQAAPLSQVAAYSPVEPPRPEPAEQTEPPARPLPRPQPQPRPQQPREPARVSEEERSAAQQLRAQSQAWKSGDDGWTLWPLSDEPANAEMTLTPEELRLIEAQLRHAPSQDEPDTPAIRAGDTDVEAFTPSHTLAEDAARVTEPKPAHRPEPERPLQGAWEPETPAPRKGPSSDFDLLGSLRHPIELPQPHAESEPHAESAIGRLLGHRATADATLHESAPRTPRPAKAPRQRGTEPTPWPAATQWIDRPIERHDWWADTDAAASDREAPADAVPPASPEPSAARAEVESRVAAASAPIVFATLAPEPEREAEPVRSTEPEPDQATLAQQPLFTMPPVSTDRWAATKPDMPSPAPVAPWPPVGARWPSQASPTALWPLPQADVPSSFVAAGRVEQAEMPESPLVAALWAESAQRVLDRGTVRVCHSCALPVSTQARYCRRCGTRQG
jgi:hypothetical protein